MIAADLHPIDADEGQLSQVINNLVINAKQAMSNGGMITISAENVAVSESDGLPLKVGDYICITVQDRGVGIPDVLLPKIFDPFFTTKPKGHGLGLATSYSIIKQHHGYLTVQSQPDVGTSFFIYLPALYGKVEFKLAKTDLLPNGSGRILFMDDEETIRKFAREILSAFGYEVECVKDGHSAIASYRAAMERGQPFDGVILDLTIPGGLGGKETVQQLLALDPKVKAIVSSGYSMTRCWPTIANTVFAGGSLSPTRWRNSIKSYMRSMARGGRWSIKFDLKAIPAPSRGFVMTAKRTSLI